MSVAITSCFSSSWTNLALSARSPPPRKGPRRAGARAPLPPMCLCARAQSHGPASWVASGHRSGLPLAHALSLLQGAGRVQPRWALPCEDSAPHPLKMAEGRRPPMGSSVLRLFLGPSLSFSSLLVSRGLGLPGFCSPSRRRPPVNGPALKFEKAAKRRKMTPHLEIFGVPSSLYLILMR